MRAAALLIAALVLPMTAIADPLSPRVHVAYDLAFRDVVGYKDCTVPVEANWTLVQVIDGSLLRCIRSWVFDAGGIRCVDRICSPTHWRIFLNGAEVPTPFWTTRVQGGETLEIVYLGGEPPSI